MRNFVLVLGALIAVVAAVFLTLDPGSDAVLDSPRVDQGGAPEPSSSTPGPAELSVGPTRRTVPSTAPAQLDVQVIDRKGGPLPDAEISLFTDGEDHTGRGNHSFKGLMPGRVTLRVRHPDYPVWERSLELEAGARTHQNVQLRLDLQLQGLVIDRFGQPLGGEQLWFLRSNQRHPSNAGEAQGLLTMLTDRSGRARFTLPEPGQWRLSVGRVGQQVLADDERVLSLGDPTNFEVVLAGHTRLEVRCPVVRESGALTAILMHRPDQAARLGEDLEEARPPGSDGRGAPKLDPARAKRMEADLAARRAAGVHRLDDEAGRVAPPPMAPEWVNRQSRRVANDGKALFTDLPPGRELRLALVRQGERRESNGTLTLVADERTIAEVDLPATGAAGGAGGADQVLPLAVRWRRERLAPDERPAGVYWRD